MTSDKRKSTVPELRFPEFHCAGDWHFQPLSEIAEPISDRVGTTKCVPMSVTTGVGLVSQEDKFGRIIAGDSYKNYIRLQANDFAYNKSATKEFPQGYIARYAGTKDAGVPNSIFSCFRPNTVAVIPEYLDHLFHGNYHGRWLRRFITVGARAHGALRVSDDELFAMPVPFPPAKVSREEQQKIADCLHSLDDLIEAQGRKLESLRQHKQGLKQQLFPQTGETVPRLRFADFAGGRDWEWKRLERIAENLDNMRVPITEKDRQPGTTPYYGASGVVDYVDGYIFNEELLCISEDGANLLARTSPIAFSISGKSWVNNHAHVLRFERRATQTLVETYLNGTDLRDFITGIAQPKLNRGMLNSIPIPLPDLAEQQRIADCLSAIDQQIRAQQLQAAALAKHKCGLLQQLFPWADMSAS
jgi:type I restriction enzyme S subunit